MEGTAVRGDLIDELLDAATGRLAAYGFLLTGSQPAGEALLQDAVTRVLVRHRMLSDPLDAEHRVRTAMRTIHLARVRRANSWWAPHAQDPVALTPRDPELHDQLGRALAGLTPRERAAVVLRHHDHMAIPEIAAAMRASEATVESHLDHAEASLAATLGPIAPVVDRVEIFETRRR